MRISVIGTGYLGAVHAAAMAEIGHEVLGVDSDQAKIEHLAQGRAPFFEPELPELLQRALASGRLRFSTSLADAADHADLHFVCVGTPQQLGSHAADLSAVNAVVRGLAEHLHRPALIVGKSTVPVGTAARLAAEVADLAPVGAQAALAWNPEFLREGFAVQDTLRPDRLVVGVTSVAAEQLLREVYAPVIDAGTPFLVTDLPTAELVKTAANAFLATKISFINAMSEVCEASGADVVTLADAIGRDERIGSKFLQAGLGFGGGCLPKDIRAFMARAGEIGADQALTFLREIDAINMRRRAKVLEMARVELDGTLLGRRIAVLGCSFKPDSDDVRDSPALNVAASLHLQGAQVRVHDPEATDNARKLFPTLHYTADIEHALQGAELVLHLTEWRQYRALDPAVVKTLVDAPVVIDARNKLDIQTWRDAGWRVRAMGRPAV